MGVTSNPEIARRRSLFCSYYARLGDVEEAALRAGFSPETALVEGAAILKKPAYRKMVDGLRQAFQDSPTALVCAGLQRLAFGRSNDAVRLLLADAPPSMAEIAGMDLYGVSSVKRDKSGGMEIHFFDRLKALCSLYEYCGDADGKATAHALLAALSGGPEEATP